MNARQSGQSRDRLFIVGLAVLAIAALIQARLVLIAVTGDETQAFRAQTDMQIAAARPRILDRNGAIMALDIQMKSLFAEPRLIEEPEEVFQALKTVLPDLNYTKTMRHLTSDAGFRWLKREITPRQQAQILELGLPGIDFRSETRRFYPGGPTASTILGQTDIDNRGIAGFEKHLDDTWLRELHQSGFALSKGLEPVETTIDMRVQHYVRAALLEAMEKYQAIAAAGIVLDAKTGEVVAMSSLPDFDPNRPKKDDEMLNRISGGVFEMGSTFKMFTTAMALDSGLVSLGSKFDARRPIRIGRRTITDFHGKKRILTVPEVFIYSSNIGTAKMADVVGIPGQQEFLNRIGLLTRMEGFELPEVARPRQPKVWKKVHSITISFGHGVSTTPLQTAVAAAAMVNGGTLFPPTLLPRSPEMAKAIGRPVLKPETSDAMRYMMRLNVLRGSGRRSEVPGYLVGGKTGTAEKVVDGRYSRDKRFNAFVSAFPIDDPRYVVLVTIDEPKPEEGQRYATAGMNAAPTVARIISRAAPALGVKPNFELRDTAILANYRHNRPI
jgi:cell division protein FtsI (penicillin-binding protein 3)